uniref:Uncharacterized protein n=1 Tax=Glossina palpalis gambiensis TaxID=67801 RepID=A0A1B0AVZ2_9MUSC
MFVFSGSCCVTIFLLFFLCAVYVVSTVGLLLRPYNTGMLPKGEFANVRKWNVERVPSSTLKSAIETRKRRRDPHQHSVDIFTNNQPTDHNRFCFKVRAC